MKQPGKSKPRARIYVDDANMFFAQKQMGWFIDWIKILGYFSKQFEIVRAGYYVGLKDKEDKKQKYLSRLKRNGYRVITKPIKKIYLKENSSIYKANVDVEIAADLVFDQNDYDTAILFSGDSDFEYIVKRLQRVGKKIIVCAPNKGLSLELRRCADEVVLVGKIRSLIELQKSPPPK